MDENGRPGEESLSPECRAFLLKLDRTADKAKRLRILDACVKVRRPWVEELLWEILADPNEGVRELAVRELRKLGRLRLELAARRLRHPPWYARSSALAVVGFRRLREALPAIGGAVEDANVEVRRAAAEALGEIGGEEALRLLVRLKKDANPYVRSAAETAIGKASGVRFI